ncbi:MAG: TonB family protein [Candidatus Acidiferrum sp.]
MAPISKENEVMTAAPGGPRLEDTAARTQPVALEVPVTVNGARTVEGSDKREPFSETTKTVLVFGSGAVIRLGSPVAAGQLLFLTNEKTKKEVVCQVVKSKNYRNVSGYVELEFTESVVGFWGMRFPADRIGTHTPAATVPPPVKSAPIAAIPTPPKPASPVLSSVPKPEELKPAQFPAELKTVVPASVKPEAPSMQNAPAQPLASAPPVVKVPEVAAIPTPVPANTLASSLASLLGASEMQSSAPPSKPAAPAIPAETKPAPVSTAADNSTEELKLQASRLQEQLSSMLFSAAPTAKSAPPAPSSEAKSISGLPAKVIEIAKSEPSPVKSASTAKTLSPPIKSSLDTEEVKIPSWLEPLARNAAASSSSQEPQEREKAKHPAAVSSREEEHVEASDAAESGGSSEAGLPAFGSLLQLTETTSTHEQPARSSRKGVWIGAIAAAFLLAAGGVWYQFYFSNGPHATPSPASPVSAASTPARSAPPENSEARPVEHPESGNGGDESDSRRKAPEKKTTEATESVPVTRDNTRDAATTIPAAVTERIPPSAAAPEPKKPSLGQVYLASPTINHPETPQNNPVDAPAITSGNSSAPAAGLDSPLATGSEKQPAAPEVPLPIGGDVKPAKLLRQVAPIYPALASNQHVTGNVVIDALIDANGRVTSMKVLSGPILLQQAAKDALRQWKYQPATLDGKPVAMHVTVTLQFGMQ